MTAYIGINVLFTYVWMAEVDLTVNVCITVKWV